MMMAGHCLLFLTAYGQTVIGDATRRTLTARVKILAIRIYTHNMINLVPSSSGIKRQEWQRTSYLADIAHRGKIS